ncbi:MAG: Hint domain-containing protein [Rhodobacter sp.]|nr:Hint domain-containing protein [Rhodobacter sp.]
MTIGYSPEALVYDPIGGTWSLRPDYDPALHRLELIWDDDDDDDAYLDGDQTADDVGYDATQNVLVRTMDGTAIARGQVHDEDHSGLTVGGSGPVIDMERLEIGGKLVGYVVTQPLRPGVTYEETCYDNVTAGNTLHFSRLIDVMGFGPATMISTIDGDLPVEWLSPGDRVITRDHGAQPLRWVGRFHVTAQQMAGNPDLRPVELGVGALGSNAPTHPLLLSPLHRVLLTGADVQLHFGAAEVLAVAKHLAVPAPRGLGLGGFTYTHLLFDAHQIVRANGLWCESLFAGGRADRVARTSAARPPAVIRHGGRARPCLAGWEARFVADLRGLAVHQRPARAA